MQEIDENKFEINGYCMEISKTVGVRFISVDAYNSETPINFYKKYNFTKLIKSKYNILSLCIKI